jgi:hypothetical protein
MKVSAKFKTEAAPKKGSIATGGLLWRHPPLRYRVSDLPPEKLVIQIESALAELSAQAKAGRDKAKDELERLMSALDSWYQNELRERAKAGDKSFHHSSTIAELLWLAGDTIECLAWLAKNRSEDCARHARSRKTWPAFISFLRSTEAKSQALKEHLKKNVQWGQKFSHYKPNTETDKLFRAAEFIIEYVSESDLDWRQFIVFAPFIKGLEWTNRDDCREAIDKFRQEQGAITQSNWPKWKPVFERCITFHYARSNERWKLIPDSRTPKSLRLKYKSQIPKTWKEFFLDADHAARLGIADEWLQYCFATKKLTPVQRDELQAKVKAAALRERHPSIMDIEPDNALKLCALRAADRNGGWGDYKAALLNKCKRLLPP